MSPFEFRKIKVFMTFQDLSRLLRSLDFCVGEGVCPELLSAQLPVRQTGFQNDIYEAASPRRPWTEFGRPQAL